jgi:small subunit ribosomal protein S7
MARRNRAEKREVTPDARYNSVLVSQIVNKMMLAGKKSTAEQILYGAMDNMEAAPRHEVLEQLCAMLRR